MRTKLLVEPIFELINLPSQRGIARVQQIAAADRIRMHKDVGGINEATASMHQYRHGASIVALRCKPMQQGHVRLFPVRQIDPIKRPARLLAIVAERDGSKDGGSGVGIGQAAQRLR